MIDDLSLGVPARRKDDAIGMGDRDHELNLLRAAGVALVLAAARRVSLPARNRD
jgi:hypothetical protein